MNILTNEFLEVGLHPKGAEIIKIVGKQDGLNYMWKRDPIQWANSAPILFPIIGKVVNDTYRVEGKEYHLTGHGFSRHSEYDVIESSDTKVVYQLKSNEELLKVYPYHFVLTVTYQLTGKELSCNCHVENIDSKEIYFQVGGHPAFACPLLEGESSNDYYLEFEKNETVKQRIIDSSVGFMSDQSSLFLDNEKRFFIRQQLFNTDAIVLEQLQSNYVDLKSFNHDKYIRFYMEGFNFLGIWAAKHVGGLIAIEPWVGHTDFAGFTGELKEKAGVCKLEKGKEFSCCFKIEVNQ